MKKDIRYGMADSRRQEKKELTAGGAEDRGERSNFA
jgi:hypothetical protein